MHVDLKNLNSRHRQILTVLSFIPGAYGVPIMKALDNLRGLRTGTGHLYTLLNELETAQLIVSRPGEGTPERGGRAKRHFELTESGKAKVREIFGIGEGE